MKFPHYRGNCKAADSWIAGRFTIEAKSQLGVVGLMFDSQNAGLLAEFPLDIKISSANGLFEMLSTVNLLGDSKNIRQRVATLSRILHTFETNYRTIIANS